MTDKKFQAILSKNDIAREIRDYRQGDIIAIEMVRSALKDIEKYIGQGNQPTTEDIITCDKFRL